MFYINVVPGLICIALVLLVIPNTREATRPSLDLPGLLTLVVSLVSLLITLTQGQQHGWDTPYIQRLLLIAGFALVAFVCLKLFQKEPLVDLQRYTNLAFAGISRYWRHSALSADDHRVTTAYVCAYQSLR